MYWNTDTLIFGSQAQRSWIVTLDVLKSTKTGTKMDGFFGWIVTLDVLKYVLWGSMFGLPRVE